MKAIRVAQFGGPEVMKLEELPDPQPGPRQVVVRIHAAGVNPVDTYLRSGTYPIKPQLPYTPGMDAAGTIESIGEGVSHFKPGDRVYVGGSLSGTYAEKALCKDSQVHRLPERVSFGQGAGVYVPYGTAYRALFQKARAVSAETVLVHGASGGVGIAAIQFARAAGMVVIGTAGTEEGRRLVREHGADHALDHRTAEHFDRIMEITGGRGVDVVLEMLANVNLGRDLKLLARGGRVVVIGSRGTVEVDPRDTMARETSILGMTLMNVSGQDECSLHAAIIAGLENGTLRPVVGKEIPLADAPRAHHEILEQPACGKIALMP